MPANDREVYDHFSSRPDDPLEVAALAYAGYAKAKYDWVAHIETLHGKPPTPEEIDRWISELPASRLEGIRQDAIDMFDLAARAYMAAEIEAAEEKARDDAIVRQVTSSNDAVLSKVEAATASVQAQVNHATGFKSTFWSNLTIGVAASLAFSVLLIIFGAIFNKDPSPIALFRSLQSAPPGATAPPQ